MTEKVIYNSTLKLVECIDFFFFFFAVPMWKFPGQGLNPRHSSNLSNHCGDNARSLTHCATKEKEFPAITDCFFFFFFFFCWVVSFLFLFVLGLGLCRA